MLDKQLLGIYYPDLLPRQREQMILLEFGFCWNIQEFLFRKNSQKKCLCEDSSGVQVEVVVYCLTIVFSRIRLESSMDPGLDNLMDARLLPHQILVQENGASLRVLKMVYL